ncbi:hypothetical protein [Arthrobacter sp. H20]|uniref:hypothetical protein n=1 Tax=Arthrobacter sp. H20 TaxID=1267981 RepID=UPI0004BAFF16|nr:hypothetical protein [Arthrobacter sp. H20]
MKKIVGAAAALLVVIGVVAPASPALSAANWEWPKTVVAANWEWPKTVVAENWEWPK